MCTTKMPCAEPKCFEKNFPLRHVCVDFTTCSYEELAKELYWHGKAPFATFTAPPVTFDDPDDEWDDDDYDNAREDEGIEQIDKRDEPPTYPTPLHFVSYCDDGSVIAFGGPGMFDIPKCPTCGQWMNGRYTPGSSVTFFCSHCPPAGKVKCPADHKPAKECILCKNSGFVEELT